LTYNGYFSTKVVLDLTLLDRFRSFVLDDLKELLDTHGCGVRAGPGGYSL
jgi:hypothetical protein